MQQRLPDPPPGGMQVFAHLVLYLVIGLILYGLAGGTGPSGHHLGDWVGGQLGNWAGGQVFPGRPGPGY